MVSLGEVRRRQLDSVEKCVTRARIYYKQQEFCADLRRQRKHGWKLADVKWRYVPVQMERIRAYGPGALLRGTAWEMVAFYTRCGPTEHRILSRVIPHRRHASDASEERMH